MNRNIKAVEEFLSQYTDEYDNPIFYVKYDKDEDSTDIRFKKDKKLTCYFTTDDYSHDVVAVYGEVPMDFINGCYQALISEVEDDKFFNK